MNKTKLILSIISANLYLPLVAAMFPAGGVVDIFFFLIAVIHILYFAAVITKPWQHFLLSLNLAISYCGGVILNTWLYYNNICDDAMTPIVGRAIILNAAAVFLIVIASSYVYKYIKNALGKRITDPCDSKE